MSSSLLESNGTVAARGRSLRVRVGLVVGGALILLFAAFTAISTQVTSHLFADLQDHYTENKIKRVALVLDQLALSKGRLVKDNAEWDETHDFLEGRNPGYLARNYAPEVNSTDQDVILVFNSQKKLAGAVQTEEGLPTYEAPSGLDPLRLVESGLLSAKAEVGLAIVGDKVLMLASCPVLPSDRKGATNGWLVFGKYFAPQRVAELEQTAEAEVSLGPASGSELLPGARGMEVTLEALGKITAFFLPTLAWRAGEQFSNARIIIPSVNSSRSVLIEVDLEQLVYKQALRERNWFLLVSAIFGLVFVGMGLLAVEWSVLRPLAALDREMEEMSQAKGEIGLLKAGRDDEIGRLAKSANRLLDRVQAGQREARRQEELLSGVLDSAPEGVLALQCMRDAQGEIVDLSMAVLNHSCEKILQVDEGELTGKTIRETYPKLVEAGIYERWKQVAVTRQAISFETHYEGHKITGWYRNSVAPWGDGVVITVTDISERKAREQELAETLAELERFNAAMIGREERILEMKREVNRLCQQLGLPETYGGDVRES